MNLKKIFLTTILASLIHSSPAFSLTQDECQMRRDALDARIESMQANLTKLFRARSRYAIPTQRQYNRLIQEAEYHFSAICPNYVDPVQ